ncbi:MAG: phage holin family protein [Limnospira sp.]
MGVSDLLEAINAYLRRMLRLVAVLVDLHRDIALREAQREQKRLTAGFSVLAVGTAFFITGLSLLQVAAIFLLHNLGLSWLGAISIVSAADIVLGFLLIATASKRLRGPYMIETRTRIVRTGNTLFRDDPGNRMRD